MNITPLTQAILPWVVRLVSRADYKQKMGHDAPNYDPNNPVKCWMYVGPDRTVNVPNVVTPSNNPYRGSVFNLVVHEHVAGVYGQPVLEPTFISNYEAARVNLPPDQSGIVVDDMLFPIRDLAPGETIQSGFGGVPFIVGA